MKNPSENYNKLIIEIREIRIEANGHGALITLAAIVFLFKIF